MTIALSEAKEHCEKCENYSVIHEHIYKHRFLIFPVFLYTKRTCFYCGYEKDKVERERDEKLHKILA